jgi:hypothetical protein
VEVHVTIFEPQGKHSDFGDVVALNDRPLCDIRADNSLLTLDGLKLAIWRACPEISSEITEEQLHFLDLNFAVRGDEANEYRPAVCVGTEPLQVLVPGIGRSGRCLTDGDLVLVTVQSWRKTTGRTDGEAGYQLGDVFRWLIKDPSRNDDSGYQHGDIVRGIWRKLSSAWEPAKERFLFQPPSPGGTLTEVTFVHTHKPPEDAPHKNAPGKLASIFLRVHLGDDAVDDTNLVNAVVRECPALEKYLSLAVARRPGARQCNIRVDRIGEAKVSLCLETTGLI